MSSNIVALIGSSQKSFPMFIVFFYSMTRGPLLSTLFPYTTLFRSTGLGEFRTRSWYVQNGRGQTCCCRSGASRAWHRSEEHTSELQSQFHLVCRLLLEKKNSAQNFFTLFT